MRHLNIWLLVAAQGVAAMSPGRVFAKSSDLLHVFAPLPTCGLAQTPCFPTPNHRLTANDETGFAARTCTNERYGSPGWTRGQGSRFHKGVDILPIRFEKTGQTVQIDYFDPKTGRNFSVKEPVLIAKDEVYAILDGVVAVANRDEHRSGYGRYVMLQHRFADGRHFVSMYAHLDQVEVEDGKPVRLGDRIGWMGNTSSSAGGRNYLKAIPHCHFEVGRVVDSNFASTRAARALYPRILGGKFDPRNIQPYQPIEFLRCFHARPRAASMVGQTAP